MNYTSPVTIKDDVERLMHAYPRIFFACHTRHVRDPRTKAIISTTQASILDHLDDVEGTPLTILAGHLGVTPSTMSLSIDRLENAGYVRRTGDPRDGRRVLIKLTKAGLRIRESKSVLDADLVRDLLRQLSKSEREHALEGLSILAEAATRSDGKHSAAPRLWNPSKSPVRNRG